MSDRKPLDLAAIKARCEALPPPKWVACSADKKGGCQCGLVWMGGTELLACTVDNEQEGGELGRDAQRAIMQFIAAARADVPALVAELERHRAALRVIVANLDNAQRCVSAPELWRWSFSCGDLDPLSTILGMARALLPEVDRG